MNESKHTPGPWVYDPLRKEYRGAKTLVWGPKGCGYGTIANCSLSAASTFEEAAANARLITAAPELLAELESLVKRFRAIIDDTYAGTKYYDEHVAAADRADAVIRKAKGGTP